MSKQENREKVDDFRGKEDRCTRKPYPNVRAYAMHTEAFDTPVTEAEDYLLNCYQELRRAEADPIAFEKWRAWDALSHGVGCALDGRVFDNEDPELSAVSEVVATWLQKRISGQTEETPATEESHVESILTQLSGIIRQLQTRPDNDEFNGEVINLFDGELPTCLTHVEGDHAQEYAAEAFATGIYGREIVAESGRGDFGLSAVDGFCLSRVLMSCTLAQTSIIDFLMLAGVAAQRAKTGGDAPQ